MGMKSTFHRLLLPSTLPRRARSPQPVLVCRAAGSLARRAVGKTAHRASLFKPQEQV